MSHHISLFPEPDMSAAVTEVSGLPCITLFWGSGMRDHVTLFFGDYGHPADRATAARQLDELAAAVLAARAILGELPESGPVAGALPGSEVWGGSPGDCRCLARGRELHITGDPGCAFVLFPDEAAPRPRVAILGPDATAVRHLADYAGPCTLAGVHRAEDHFAQDPDPQGEADHELLTVAELAAVGATIDPTDDDDDDDEPAATSPSGFATLQHAQTADAVEPPVSLTLDRWGRVKSVTLVRLADGSTHELADGESWPTDAYDPMTVNYQQAHPMTEGERAEAWGK